MNGMLHNEAWRLLVEGYEATHYVEGMPRIRSRGKLEAGEESPAFAHAVHREYSMVADEPKKEEKRKGILESEKMVKKKDSDGKMPALWKQRVTKRPNCRRRNEDASLP